MWPLAVGDWLPVGKWGQTNQVISGFPQRVLNNNRDSTSYKLPSLPSFWVGLKCFGSLQSATGRRQTRKSWIFRLLFYMRLFKSERTENTTRAEQTYGEGNGNPLQLSCLEDPMDGGACWAISSVQSLSCVQLFWTHGLLHTRPPCPSPTPGVYTNSSPLSQWCHQTISSSVVPSPPAFNLSQHWGLF